MSLFNPELLARLQIRWKCEMKQYARPATVFMSHCWGAVWGDVVLAACHGARFGRVVWIDLFAVRQWPGNKADLDFWS